MRRKEIWFLNCSSQTCMMRAQRMIKAIMKASRVIWQLTKWQTDICWGCTDFLYVMFFVAWRDLLRKCCTISMYVGFFCLPAMLWQCLTLATSRNTHLIASPTLTNNEANIDSATSIFVVCGNDMTTAVDFLIILLNCVAVLAFVMMLASWRYLIYECMYANYGCCQAHFQEALYCSIGSVCFQ